MLTEQEVAQNVNNKESSIFIYFQFFSYKVEKGKLWAEIVSYLRSFPQLHCIHRDHAEGGAGGALAPPPYFFCRNKNKLNKK